MAMLLYILLFFSLSLVQSVEVDFFISPIWDGCEYDGIYFAASANSGRGGLCGYIPQAKRVYACPAEQAQCYTGARSCSTNEEQITCSYGSTSWCCLGYETCTGAPGQLNVCLSTFGNPNAKVVTAVADSFEFSTLGVSTVTSTKQTANPNFFMTSTFGAASISTSTSSPKTSTTSSSHTTVIESSVQASSTTSETPTLTTPSSTSTSTSTTSSETISSKASSTSASSKTITSAENSSTKTSTSFKTSTSTSSLSHTKTSSASEEAQKITTTRSTTTTATPGTVSTSSASNSGGGGLSPGVIAAISVASFLGVCIIGMLFFFLGRRYRRPELPGGNESDSTMWWNKRANQDYKAVELPAQTIQESRAVTKEVLHPKAIYEADTVVHRYELPG